jgi:hypothetical protein
LSLGEADVSEIMLAILTGISFYGALPRRSQGNLGTVEVIEEFGAR